MYKGTCQLKIKAFLCMYIFCSPFELYALSRLPFTASCTIHDNPINLVDKNAKNVSNAAPANELCACAKLVSFWSTKITSFFWCRIPAEVILIIQINYLLTNHRSCRTRASRV